MNDYGIVPILCTEGHIHFNDNLANDWSLENYTSLNKYEF
jgi:hypothetical protein